MKKSKSTATQQGGFTLVEILVVTVVFGIGIYMLTTLFSSIQNSQRDTYYLGVATHAARSEIERIRSSGFDDVNDGDDFSNALPDTLPPNSTGTIDVSQPANAPDSKQIDVTVTYPIGSLTKEVTISAYIDPPEDAE